MNKYLDKCNTPADARERSLSSMLLHPVSSAREGEGERAKQSKGKESTGQEDGRVQLKVDWQW